MCFDDNDERRAQSLNKKEQCILRVTNTDCIDDKPWSIDWSVLWSQGELDYYKFMIKM